MSIERKRDLGWGPLWIVFLLLCGGGSWTGKNNISRQVEGVFRVNKHWLHSSCHSRGGSREKTETEHGNKNILLSSPPLSTRGVIQRYVLKTITKRDSTSSSLPSQEEKNEKNNFHILEKPWKVMWDSNYLTKTFQTTQTPFCYSSVSVHVVVTKL
jgi:hypothetical protein